MFCSGLTVSESCNCLYIVSYANTAKSILHSHLVTKPCICEDVHLLYYGTSVMVVKTTVKILIAFSQFTSASTTERKLHHTWQEPMGVQDEMKVPSLGPTSFQILLTLSKSNFTRLKQKTAKLHTKLLHAPNRNIRHVKPIVAATNSQLFSSVQ